MVKLGIIVEGHSDKIFVESHNFQSFCRDLNIDVIDVINATGNGNLCSANISQYITEMKLESSPDKTLIIADLDPELCAPCITKRRERIGQDADYIVIARNAIESWFLADIHFMQSFFSESISIDISEGCETFTDPFAKLKELNQEFNNRGLRNKKQFMKRNCEQLDLNNSAAYSQSAQYLLDKLNTISNP